MNWLSKGSSVTMIVIREDGRIGWLVEDMVMFLDIVGVGGLVQFLTAQHSLAPNLPVHYQCLVMLYSI